MGSLLQWERTSECILQDMVRLCIHCLRGQGLVPVPTAEQDGGGGAYAGKPDVEANGVCIVSLFPP